MNLALRLALGAICLSLLSTAPAQLVQSRVIENFDAAVELLEIKSLSGIGEARLGNRTGTGDYELDIQDHTVTPSGLTTAQRTWVDNTSYAFELKYEAATRNVTWTVGDVTVSDAMNNPAVFDQMFLRVRGDLNNGILTKVDSLKLTRDWGSGVASRSLQIDNLTSYRVSTVDPSFTYNANAIHFGDISDTFDWTVTGNLTFDWTNASSATGSRGAIQFKIGEAFHPVPEPATMAVLGLGAAFLARRRRRKA